MLIASVVFSIPSILTRFTELGFGGQGLAYAVLLGTSWLGVVFVAYWPNGALRWIIALLLATCGYVLLTFEHASGQFMTFDSFISMLDSAGSLGDAIEQNGSAFLSAMWPSLAIAFGVGLAPGRPVPFPHKLAYGLPVAIFVAVVGLLFWRGGDGGKGLPHSLVGAAYATLAGYDEVTRFGGERRDPGISHVSKAKVRNIVLIIDESIAGGYLTINNPRGVAEALSDTPQGVTLSNYGVAASISGCSAGANQALRYGGTRDNYREILAEYPSIWSYAKRADLRTIYIDGQRSGGAYQNNMDDAERAEIDEFIQFDDVPMVDRDMAIAGELAAQLAEEDPKLILVNKVGAHFPIHDKYPDEFLKHEPVLPRGGYADVADTGDRTGFGGTAAEWQRYRNSYRNTLDWNVGEFFQRLYASADLSDAVILYTSDHGQVLHEDGSPGLTTHCSAEPPHEEGAVPLLVVQGSEMEEFDFAEWSGKNRDRSSHYMIFPTLLRLMGFDPSGIRHEYGTSLVEPSRDPMTFNRRFNARFGAEPQWREVEPGNLPQPPLED